MRALFRRAEKAVVEEELLEEGGLVLGLKQRIASLKDKEINLTLKEFELLVLF